MYICNDPEYAHIRTFQSAEHNVKTSYSTQLKHVALSDNVSTSVGHLDHVLLTQQDVIKMSDGRRNEMLSFGNIFQLCRVRSFYITDCTN